MQIVTTTNPRSTNGVLNYGNPGDTAKATAKFLNGLTISDGRYLDSTGQPSSFDVIQSGDYNDFTYTLTLEKEIAKYRDTLLNIIHPAGMKVIGRCTLSSNGKNMFAVQEIANTAKPLFDYTNSLGSTATMSADFVNMSSNTIVFDGTTSLTFDLSRVLKPGNFIQLSTNENIIVKSEITSVNPAGEPEDLMTEIGIEDMTLESGIEDLLTENQTITIKDNVWLTFPNVAYVTGIVNTNIININSITNSYDTFNNGNYSNTTNHLQDIIYIGNSIKVAGNVYTIQSIDYINKIITTTSNLTSNISNTFMSVNRTMSCGGTSNTIDQVIVWN